MRTEDLPVALAEALEDGYSFLSTQGRVGVY